MTVHPHVPQPGGWFAYARLGASGQGQLQGQLPPGASNVTPPAQPASQPDPVPDPYGGETVTLVPGRLRGYRTWTIVWPPVTPATNDPYVYPPDVQLTGITAPIGWTAAGEEPAFCHREQLVEAGKYKLKDGEVPQHPAGAPVPARGCSCGFYALHHATGMLYGLAPCPCPKHAQENHVVAGVVEGWGRVEIGSDGWRARYARVVALHVAQPRPIEVLRRKPQRQPFWMASWSASGNSLAPMDFDIERVQEMCPQAEGAYHELWHALAHKFRVPIFRSWADLVQAYPPSDLAAIRAAKQAPTKDQAA